MSTGREWKDLTTEEKINTIKGFLKYDHLKKYIVFASNGDGDNYSAFILLDKLRSDYNKEKGTPILFTFN